jgi:hypothetical protein
LRIEGLNVCIDCCLYAAFLICYTQKTPYAQYKDLPVKIKGNSPYAINIDLVSKTKMYLSLVSSDGISLSVLEAIYMLENSKINSIK